MSADVSDAVINAGRLREMLASVPDWAPVYVVDYYDIGDGPDHHLETLEIARVVTEYGPIVGGKQGVPHVVLSGKPMEGAGF